MNTLVLLINANGEGYLTQAEGTELMQAGMITVTEPVQAAPDNPAAFHVTVSEAGKAAVVTQAAAAPAAGAPVAPVAPVAPAADNPATAPPTPPSGTPVDMDGDGKTDFVIADNIAVPTIKRGGGGNRGKRAEKYPFSKLEIGQSFHVPPGEDYDKTARKMSTQVSNANKDSEVIAMPPQMTTVTKRRAKKDEAGNVLKDPQTGKKLFETYQVQEQVMQQTKFFVSRKVGQDDPQGVGVRVFRIAPEQAS